MDRWLRMQSTCPLCCIARDVQPDVADLNIEEQEVNGISSRQPRPGIGCLAQMGRVSLWVHTL
jgi:hypothetical protein